ncbi:MAG: M23 family metallopeptidase [Pseudomonadota bacterium]
MHIMLFSRRHGASRSLNLDLRLLSGLLLLVLTAALGAGVALGAWWVPAPVAPDTARLDRLLDEQRIEVGAVRGEAQRQLDAFAVHLGQLQARLTRLDALGARLTELAELDAGEFDFTLDVGQGGPQELLEGSAYAAPPFMASLDELASLLDSREQQLQVLEQVLAERRLNEAEMLSGRPVLQGYVSSPFGRRSDPFSGRLSLHKGVDFAAKAGSPVVAVAAGVVTWSGRKSGYGNAVEISHADGYVTLYAHNQRNTAKVGDLVERGQTIALVGRSGRSSGYHVHFEVTKDGRLVDPASYIARGSTAK